jgi:hypothetical protein
LRPAVLNNHLAMRTMLIIWSTLIVGGLVYFIAIGVIGG